MKTFKQFLNEQLLFEHNFISLLETYHSDKEDGYYHDSNHGKHHVGVYFTSHNKHVYDVNFAVDHSYSHEDRDHNPNENRHILHHIHKTVHDFIKEKKPKSLLFTASDRDKEKQAQKQKIYKQAAEHLAKHYGATTEHNQEHPLGGTYSAVHFPWRH